MEPRVAVACGAHGQRRLLREREEPHDGGRRDGPHRARGRRRHGEGHEGGVEVASGRAGKTNVFLKISDLARLKELILDKQNYIYFTDTMLISL